MRTKGLLKSQPGSSAARLCVVRIHIEFLPDGIRELFGVLEESGALDFHVLGPVGNSEDILNVLSEALPKVRGRHPVVLNVRLWVELQFLGDLDHLDGGLLVVAHGKDIRV